MSRKQRNKRVNHGFGAGVIVKNNQPSPDESVNEDIVLKRLSKEALQSMRQGNSIPRQVSSGASKQQSVRVLNEGAQVVSDSAPSAQAVPNQVDEQTNSASISLTPEELTGMIQLAVEAAAQPFTQQIETLKAEQEAAKAAEADRIASLEREKQAALDKVAVFNNLFKITGNPEPVIPTEAEKNSMGAPNFNRTVNSKSDKPQGALAEFMSITGPVRSMEDGGQFVSTASAEHRRFLQKNLNQLIVDLETYGKNNGLFRGRSAAESSLADTNAVTTMTDLPGGFLETLSPIVRQTHRPSTIFWQFADERLDFAAGKGDTIDIYRAGLAAPIADPNDRLLSGGGAYADIVNTSDNLETGLVKVSVNEWGRGKTGSNASPIAITRFIQTFSMIELLNILNDKLMHDYELWQDIKCRRMWTPTSRVIYNNANQIATAPAQVPSTADGRCTWQFLNQLFGYMRTLQIPTYRDGCYGIALTTKNATQLRDSLGERFSFYTVVDMEGLLNILNLAEAGEAGKVTGYIGKIQNFHVFESNNFSAGLAGTDGVRSEAITGGNATTRTNFAFGANTFGRGIAEPFQLVNDEVTNFRRRQRVTWISWEGFGALDVDATGYNDTSALPQQLRVLDVRFTD